jgi:hypothetical protein
MDGGWTVEILRQHFDELLAERDRRYHELFALHSLSQDASMTAARDAVTKAETATERRFESVNEFRSQLSDQARTFLPRPEYETRHESLISRIVEMERRMERAEGRGLGSAQMVSYVVAAISIAIAVAALVIRS